MNHIIVRGIERRNIFRDDSDRQYLVKRLGKIIADAGAQCFAWALLPNHVHMLLRTGDIPIATFMRRLLTGYAVYFNRKYNRHGQLFQNRYKSILCQEEVYLKELVRYIHLNPLRADLVSDMEALDVFPWCGHHALVNRSTAGWQNTDDVLLLFSENRQLARRKYRLFVKSGIEQGKRKDLTGGGLIRSFSGWSEVKKLRKAGIRMKGDERILGDTDFVINVLRQADERFERKTLLGSKGYDFNKIIENVSEILEIEPGSIIRPGKQPDMVKARSLACFWCNRELGMRTVEIAERLNITQSAVSKAVRRGSQIAEKNGYELLGRKE